MKKIIKSLGEIEISPIRAALIKVALAIMVVGSILGKLISQTQPFFAGIQIPLLWLTAYVTLSELIAIRKAIEDRKNDDEVFSPLTKHVLNQMADAKEVALYLGEDSIAILEELNKVATFAKPPVFVYLPVDAYIPDLASFSKLKKAEFRVTHITHSSSFMLLQQADDTRDICLLGVCDKKGAVFAELENSEKYAEHLLSISIDIEKNSVLVSKYSKHILQHIAYESHETRLDAVRNERIKLINSAFFSVASKITSEAEKSLTAVDFIPPSKWVSDPLMSKYADAHAKGKGLKRRVHVFSQESLNSENWDLESYVQYIEVMEKAEVELRFLDFSLFDRSRFEQRGSLVIDDSVVAIAINAIDGAPFGELSYSDSVVSSYLVRFNELWESGNSSEQFIQSFPSSEG